MLVHGLSTKGHRVAYDPAGLTTDVLERYSIEGHNPVFVSDEKNKVWVSRNGDTYAACFDHVQTSPVVVRDADGVIRLSCHNIITHSENFEHSDWARTRVNVVANAMTAPDGSVTADLIVATSANNTHFVSQTVNMPLGTTFTVYMRPDGYNHGFLYSGGPNKGVGINLLTAEVYPISGWSLMGGTTATLMPDGWVRVTSDKDGSGWANVFVGPHSGTGGGSFAGDNVRGIYAWGAHMYQSGMGGMQANPDTGDTYVKATDTAAHTRGVHYSKDRSVYVPVVPAATNMTKYSLPASTADWQFITSGRTFNDDISPDGTKNALSMYETADGKPHYMSQDVTLIENDLYTMSVYLKSAGCNMAWINITGHDTGRVWMNFTTGKIGTTRNGSTATLIAVGDGWYYLTATINAFRTDGQIHVGTGETDDLLNYIGDPSKGILISRIQVEHRNFATPYVHNTNATLNTRDDIVVTIPISNLGMEEQMAQGTWVTTYHNVHHGGADKPLLMSSDTGAGLTLTATGVSSDTTAGAGELLGVASGSISDGKRHRIGWSYKDTVARALCLDGSTASADALTAADSGFPDHYKVMHDGANPARPGGGMGLFTFTPYTVTNATLRNVSDLTYRYPS